jgi:D-tyrosyl-tRNA(Tyr) deacylase
MRVVVQRVKNASVVSNGLLTGEINSGLLVLVGFTQTDGRKDIDWMIGKLINLRIFSDDEGKMNRSVQDINGEILLVSQF